MSKARIVTNSSYLLRYLAEMEDKNFYFGGGDSIVENVYWFIIYCHFNLVACSFLFRLFAGASFCVVGGGGTFNPRRPVSVLMPCLKEACATRIIPTDYRFRRH